MKQILSLLSVLFLILNPGMAGMPVPAASPIEKTVGIDVRFEDITDFYYTYDASSYPPHYQRYRFYVEDGKHYFYHETREGDSWPQPETDITCSGTAELTDKQWTEFCGLLNGGAARLREESLDCGDAGPWMYVYWLGGEEEGREFYFRPTDGVLDFESFCEALKTAE